jgi:hypothetical protein
MDSLPSGGRCRVAASPAGQDAHPDCVVDVVELDCGAALTACATVNPPLGSPEGAVSVESLLFESGFYTNGQQLNLLIPPFESGACAGFDRPASLSLPCGRPTDRFVVFV